MESEDDSEEVTVTVEDEGSEVIETPWIGGICLFVVIAIVIVVIVLMVVIFYMKKGEEQEEQQPPPRQQPPRGDHGGYQEQRGESGEREPQKETTGPDSESFGSDDEE